MTDNLTPDELARLTAADPDDLRQALSHALQYDGRKRNHRAESLAASIVANHLVQTLERANYVIMRKPPAYDATAHLPRAPLKE